MAQDDPILETAYYLTVGRRGETRVFLVQGRFVGETSSVAIIRSRPTTVMSQDRAGRPAQDSPGPSSATR